MSSPTIVVGGGAIGLSIAWELAKRGERVMLLEREP
ncbi:MAG: FAD-binding oxidoreductase, partial [Pirellulales bacterium]|nr:FAD-binding oxidoreductase [Pirellulales bacterium]